MSTPTTLPVGVVETDRKLQKATDELAKLRWHWTLDETNSERGTFSDYARQVGVSESAVRNLAHSYADKLSADSYATVRTPGQPQTVSDFLALRKVDEERQQAVKAIAKASGVAVDNVARNKRDEVEAVISTARERALARGTTVEHEIERAADWREKGRATAKSTADERKARHTSRYIEIEGDIGVAMQRLRKVLADAEGVEFSPDERELLTEALSKLRALLRLVDLRIVGETNVDWDAELEKLVS